MLPIVPNGLCTRTMNTGDPTIFRQHAPQTLIHKSLAIGQMQDDLMDAPIFRRWPLQKLFIA